ncbi:MAG: hypothetical protein PHV13_05370 [Candidatus ainarchaeum sp.]|nr:hypothetical protein [Candidatus ainarchaeum sp.]
MRQIFMLLVLISLAFADISPPPHGMVYLDTALPTFLGVVMMLSMLGAGFFAVIAALAYLLQRGMEAKRQILQKVALIAAVLAGLLLVLALLSAVAYPFIPTILQALEVTPAV